MSIHPSGVWVAIAAALCVAMSAVTAAQDSPPGRAAQLSDLEGSVSLEPAGTQNWIAAELNRPVTVGDRLWADRHSRAELDIGDAVIRLGSFTGFSFLNLDRRTAQMQVTAGTVIVHVRGLADGEQDEIDTPNLALSLEQPGTYRVDVSERGDTTIVEVVSGEALASGDGQTFPVSAQQSVTFMGTHRLTADYATLGAPDAFDDWSMARDRQEAAAAAAVGQYVSPDVVGADDLAAYGSWQYTTWGYAWFPVVPMDWAPYSVGYWAWVSPWGWTWVDEEPWGYAPFHYGRWGRWHGGWCWVPGPRVVRPIFAPALVAFTHGPLGRAGGARRAVGWIPLGPRDVYLPGYAASRRYVRDINTTNTTSVNPTAISALSRGHFRPGSYQNSTVAGAVTVVPRSVFTTAQPVGAHRIVLPRHGGMTTRFTSEAPAVTPVKASVLGPAARVVALPPRRLVDRPVVARMAPSRAPVPFAAQQSAIRANGGHPLTSGQWAHLRPNRPAVPVRLAGATAPQWRVAPRPQGASRPQRPPAFERSGVPSNRPPWAGEPSRTVPAAAPVLRGQPSVPRPAVRGTRPPWAQGGPAPPPAMRAPAREAQRPQWSSAPRYRPAPPRSVSPPRYASPPRQVRPAPRFQPHFAAPRPSSPPAAHAPSGSRFSPRAQMSFTGPGADAAAVSAPPMYRAQPVTDEPLAPAASFDAGPRYAPPVSPPPMYRPVGERVFGGSAPRAAFAPRWVSPRPGPGAARFAAAPLRSPRVVFRR